MSWSVEPVSKDEAEWSDLCKLFHVTDPQNLGIGRDVKETGAYTGLTPVCAWKIDAPSRLSKYDAAKEEIIDALAEQELELPEVSTKLDDVAESLYDLDSQVNEKVLLHGTKPETLITLLQNGLSERFSGGLFGCGSYLAEDASKIDQYCTSDSQKEGNSMLHKKLYEECDVKKFDNVFYAIIVRVALGHPVFTKDGETNKDPPHGNIFANQEKRELALIPSKSEMPIHYHSLIADVGPASEGYKCARHREFVVFDSARIIEEYVVGYLRDMAPANIPGTIAEPQYSTVVADDSGLDDALRAECGNANKTTNAKASAPPVKMFPVEVFTSGAAGIAISPCGTFALVGNNSDSEADYKLGRIDLQNGALTFPYSGLSDSPWSVAIAPNSAFALVGDKANDKIVRVDLKEGSINLTYADVETANQVAIAPCGTFALAACEDYKIARIDVSKASSGDVTFPFADLDVQPQGIAIAPCGSYALYSHENSKGGIGHIDLKTGETDAYKYMDNRLERCDHIVISPTGTFALVAASSHGRLDLRTDELTFVEDYEDDKLDIQYPLGVCISPSETYALVTCGESGKVFCISNAAKAWKPAPSEQFDEEEKKCCCSLM